MLQHYITNPKVHAPSSCPITHPHVFSIRPPCFLHMPWCHTFYPTLLSYVITLHLCRTCVHHVCIMRNPCPLMSLSRSWMVDLILFFTFYFILFFIFLFFYFSIFRTTWVRVISHAVTSVTNWWYSHKTDHRTWENGVEGSGTKWRHTA